MSHDLDHRLRAAAEPVARGRVHSGAAQDLLERVVATPRDAHRPRTVVRHRTRWALAGAAAAAVTAATLAVPGLGGDGEAYASWTATPAPMAAGDTTALGRDCMRELAASFGDRYPETDLTSARKVLGERRGKYGYLAVATPGWSATCFRDAAGAVHSGSIMESPVSDAKLGRRGVELQGWGQLETGEGYARLMSGHLGSDVAGVDVTIPDGTTVRATVEDRYFVAWYPEAVDETRPTTLTLRLADGSTVGGLSARDLYEAPALD
jgi:hypothetical protein